MANGFMDALGRFGKGFALGMAPPQVQQGFMAERMQEREMQRQQEAMNPIRQALLDQLQPRNVFEGGPSSDFEGPTATATPLQTGGPQPAPAGAQPAPGGAQRRAARTRPFQPLPETLPPDLRPPPEIDSAIQDAARRHGVPVNALRAIASQESGGHGFRPDVVGETPIDLPGQEGDRAVGVFQFTPQTAQGFGIDPRDPAQSADAAARMLREELDQGSSLPEAMAAHFGGPNRGLWGPRTQRYMQEVAERFQTLEQVAPEGQAMMQPVAEQPGAVQVGPGEQRGPFGSVTSPPQEQQDFGRRLLQVAAQDPRAFAEMFAGEGGLEQIMALAQGSRQEQTRVVSGDTAEGRAIGLQPGERARVKGQISQGGAFFPTEVVAQPFDQPGQGGSLVNLYDLDSGQIISRRRDDPEVDRLVQGGAVIVPDGAALETLNNMSKKDREILKDAEVSTRNYIDTVRDGIEMLDKQPDINTWVARGAAWINDFRQETKALGSALGMEFEENILDVSVHNESFRQLGIDNERMQSLITSLAFQRAAAEKGGQGRITNRDIERFIREIGGKSSDPVTLTQTLIDTAERAERSFRNNWQVRTGSQFQGTLGTDKLPRPSQQEFDSRSSVEAPPRREEPAVPSADIPTISNDAEYDALPSGATFIAPDGTTRRKP